MSQEDIIAFIKAKGPIVPMDLANNMRVESYIASAHLSDLLSKKLIQISSLKLGSSPLYFLPEQKSMLEKFSNHLHQKDQAAFNELKANKVLQDSQISPLLRVSLRNIKDFAVPLEVTYKNKKEIFWKFYSLSNDEASETIRTLLLPKEEIKEEPLPEPEVKKTEVAPVEIVKKEVKESEVEKVKPISKPEPKPVKQEPKPVTKKVTKPKVKEVVVEKKAVKPKKETQKHISNAFDSSDKFLKQVGDYFSSIDAEVVTYDIIKKESEIDLEVEIPSSIGILFYFCKAKNKKRLNDSDIHAAYVGGELKKLPSILLAPGSLTKTSQEKLGKEFRNIIFVQL
ncbi:hypothetical protein HN592_05035 [Candidatus Woesearchaeota archaeon]|jgi:hypothetical protein|nr:hypothetical protein [Candidatus Woesearchaeota archaeon]MBT4367751.1 hypothetical protein [Candidatus Woesearchaeota archaeon]MBT4712239.1 hypothetical protein [Candidatus Woesearchaeota archaeon]MBT6638787.1 hypothetical protein [Candidatus Woesearchaeota archaeon]MBT7134431.1 hypothetical protein [Candidatus Woesearchaeota archaeon]